MLYRVKNWDEIYENHRTRPLKKLDWVPVPNKMDGAGYAELMSHRNGCAHFGAWMAILSIASKCEPRGSLIRATGEPHDLQSLSHTSRIPIRVLKAALPRLLKLRWLEEAECSEVVANWTELAAIAQPSDAELSRSVRTVAEFKELRCVSAPDSAASTRTRAPALPFRSLIHNSSVERTTRKTSERFAEFWARWVNGTKDQVGEIQAAQAYVSVVYEDEEDAAFECLQSYLRSGLVSRGIISGCAKWIFTNAENQWRSRWAIPRAEPARMTPSAAAFAELERRVASGEVS